MYPLPHKHDYYMQQKARFVLHSPHLHLSYPFPLTLHLHILPSMPHPLWMTLFQCLEKLEHNPLLLNHSQKWSRANSKSKNTSKCWLDVVTCTCKNKNKTAKLPNLKPTTSSPALLPAPPHPSSPAPSHDNKQVMHHENIINRHVGFCTHNWMPLKNCFAWRVVLTIDIHVIQICIKWQYEYWHTIAPKSDTPTSSCRISCSGCTAAQGKHPCHFPIKMCHQ